MAANMHMHSHMLRLWATGHRPCARYAKPSTPRPRESFNAWPQAKDVTCMSYMWHIMPHPTAACHILLLTCTCSAIDNSLVVLQHCVRWDVAPADYTKARGPKTKYRKVEVGQKTAVPPRAPSGRARAHLPDGGCARGWLQCPHGQEEGAQGG